jgi:phenylalanyl-tRNA synthetase beta chain
VMRTSGVPAMLNMLAYNLNRGVDDVKLFEAGNLYEMSNGRSLEIKRITLGATGNALLPTVNQAARPYSFYDLKGDIETLLGFFEYDSLQYEALAADYYHSGRSASAIMDGLMVAQFGQLQPRIASSRKLRQDVFIAELYLDRLYRHKLRKIQYEPLPRYPAVQRDFSFIFPDSVLFENIRSAVEGLGIRELRSFVPVEIFRGGAISAGKYSLLLRGVFQSGERTLREDEVAQWTKQIVQALETLGGTLRAS